MPSTLLTCNSVARYNAAHTTSRLAFRISFSTQASSGIDDTSAALNQLRDVISAYGGLPTQQETERLVDAMRAKRSKLQGDDKRWNGITEEAYNRLMRVADPWRVVELQPKLAQAIYTFPLAYVALLAVQQFVPKFFNVAYGVGAAFVLLPLFLQIVLG